MPKVCGQLAASPEAGQDGYDEAFVAPGEPRAHYAELLSAFARLDLATLRAAMSYAITTSGRRRSATIRSRSARCRAC